MGDVIYSSCFKNEKYNQSFLYKVDEEGKLKGIWNKKDSSHMNWLREDFQWGKVVGAGELSVQVSRSFTEQGNLQETYVFTNENPFEVFVLNHDIGIYTTFPDNYKSSEICMRERSHVHVWCGKNTSYIYALRMGGTAPHLGLVLTKGSLSGYSIERNLARISNDRGSIIVHPEGFCLRPGECYCLQWELMWFDMVEEFFRKMSCHDQVIQINVNKYLFFEGESMRMEIRYHDAQITGKDIQIKKNGEEISYALVKQKDSIFIQIEEKKNIVGAEKWDIKIKDYRTYAEILVQPELETLIEKRCEFIAEKQQYRDVLSPLYGSFLIYDTEEGQQYYSHLFDHNGGRERIGMGVLMAAWLQKKRSRVLERSLELFTDYVYRELYDEETGTVYNDVRRDNEWHRLYNYPWMAVFFMERYRLYRQERDLKNMWKVLMVYYKNGGNHFYAIAIPVTESMELLEEAGWQKEKEELKCRYREHADYLASNGLRYPAHEVNYEQSIVAPAVAFLFQAYQITKEQKYFEAGRCQLAVLELFSGCQPSFYLYETAIRHWDGYWFGKRRNFGDTFPHYWSALSGNAYKIYYEITGDNGYRVKAEHSLRGTLSLIHADGSASCAFVYPVSVNGAAAHYADPWANDQDWGLYFYLKK